MSIITKDSIRSGDKLKVTFLDKGIEYTFIGVAHKMDCDSDWLTAEHGLLTNKYNKDEVIELLERPKSAAQILRERRNNLAYQYSEGVWNFDGASPSTRKAIDHIIFLEDEKKALVS